MRVYTWKKLVGIAATIACLWAAPLFERGTSLSVWAQSAMIPSSSSSTSSPVGIHSVGCPVEVSPMGPVVMVPFNIVPGTVQYAPSGAGFALPTGPVAVAIVYPEPMVSPTTDSICQVQYAQQYQYHPQQYPQQFQYQPQQYQQIAQYQAMLQWQQAMYQQYYQQQQYQQYQQQYYQQWLRQQELQKNSMNPMESAANTGTGGSATASVAGQSLIFAASPAVAAVGNFPPFPPAPPYSGYGMGMMPTYGGYGMGMMPPIIVLGNNNNDSARRPGLFARRRANRQQSVSQWMNPSQSLSSGGGMMTGSMAHQQQMANQWATPYVQANLPQMAPSVSAYPYGYFGAATMPQQTNTFGGYYNSYRSSATIPGTGN